MSDNGRGLENYIEVKDRIIAFYKKYPEGNLSARILEDDGQRVLMRAYAYRQPEDASPGIGHAEEVRGQGMVNKTSAVENCETSAWGRALAALGFETQHSIASREEVEQAIAEGGRQEAEGPSRHAAGLITPNQLEKFVKRVAKRHQLTDDDLDTLARGEFGVEAVDQLPKGRVDEFVKRLETGEPIRTGETDVPAEALPVGDPGPEHFPFD